MRHDINNFSLKKINPSSQDKESNNIIESPKTLREKPGSLLGILMIQRTDRQSDLIRCSLRMRTRPKICMFLCKVYAEIVRSK
jgi:hypothetical protein